MKQGVTLQQISADIVDQERRKRDWIVPTSKLDFMHLEDGKYALTFDDGQDWVSLEPTQLCHRQIGERLQIPSGYYDRMRQQAPDLLMANVRRWLALRNENRMVRALDDSARAFLSDRYRPRDNLLLLRSVLSVLEGSGREMRFQSAALTESRFYLKVTFPQLERQVKPGDIVHAGLLVSNSEVGLGQTEVSPLIFSLICSNGLIADTLASKRRHVGSQLGGGDSSEAFDVWSQTTIDLDDATYRSKLEDITRAALDETVFDKLVARAREASQDPLSGSGPQALVKRVAAAGSLSEAEGDGLLRHLIEGGDLSRWGVVNAVTRLSQDIESYDRATDLERLGGRLLGPLGHSILN